MKDTVSIYNGISPKPKEESTWQEALKRIRDGTYKSQIDYVRSIEDLEQYRKEKRNLPAVTFCGKFNGNRAKEKVMSTTGFIIPDLDHIENVESVFELLSQDEKVWFAFRSPSGEGIKCGIRAKGIETDDDIKKFYNAVEHYFKDVYGINLDPACKDISRLTFFSHDPNLFINEKPYFFNIKAWETPKNDISNIDTHGGTELKKLSGKKKYAWKVLQSCCDEIKNSPPGTQHHIRLKMSRYIGGYAHYLDDNTILSEMEKAVRASGAKNVQAAMKTVADGLKHGKKSPIEIEDKHGPQWAANETNETNVSHETHKNSRSLTLTNAPLTLTNDTNAPKNSEKERFGQNLTAHIEQYIQENQGSFTYSDIDREFGITHPKDKILRRQACLSLQKKNYIRKDTRVAGKFHIIKQDIEFIDLDAVEEEHFPLILPLGLSEMVRIPPHCVCVVAGTSNAGKTAFLMELLKLNLTQKYPKLYLMSEMGPSEFKQRVRMLDIDMASWKQNVRAASVSSGFDGPIVQHNQDGISVIDFLEEVDGEYYRIASDIRNVYDALGNGVAFLALQKHSKAAVGRGGEATTEKARLYLTLDMLVHRPRATISALKIIKAKDYQGDNPNGKEIHIEIKAGKEIVPISDWMYCNQKQREQWIAKYEHMVEQDVSVPVAGDMEVIYRFLCDDGSYGNLRRKHYQKMLKKFPDVNVDQILSELSSWTKNKKPARKKDWFGMLNRSLYDQQKAITQNG